MPRKYILVNQVYARTPFVPCMVHYLVKTRSYSPSIASSIPFLAESLSSSRAVSLQFDYDRSQSQNLSLFVIVVSSSNRVVNIGSINLDLCENPRQKKEYLKGILEQNGFIIYSTQDSPFYDQDIPFSHQDMSRSRKDFPSSKQKEQQQPFSAQKFSNFHKSSSPSNYFNSINLSLERIPLAHQQSTVQPFKLNQKDPFIGMHEDQNHSEDHQSNQDQSNQIKNHNTETKTFVQINDQQSKNTIELSKQVQINGKTEDKIVLDRDLDKIDEKQELEVQQSRTLTRSARISSAGQVYQQVRAMLIQHKAKNQHFFLALKQIQSQQDLQLSRIKQLGLKST